MTAVVGFLIVLVLSLFGWMVWDVQHGLESRDYWNHFED